MGCWSRWGERDSAFGARLVPSRCRHAGRYGCRNPCHPEPATCCGLGQTALRELGCVRYLTKRRLMGETRTLKSWQPELLSMRICRTRADFLPRIIRIARMEDFVCFSRPLYPRHPRHPRFNFRFRLPPLGGDTLGNTRPASSRETEWCKFCSNCYMNCYKRLARPPSPKRGLTIQPR